MGVKKICLILCSFFLLAVQAQNIRINEATSSNSIFLDEDGDTPDWLELHNYGDSPIYLNNWSLSDDPDNLSKWTFSDLIIHPDEYLVVWASGKNRFDLSYAKTLVKQGDVFRYLIPNSQTPSNWTAIDFDDSNWQEGSSGFGYSDGDDETILPNGTLSVFLRINFEISDIVDLSTLILDMDYDDGFVAYINGREIARANINGVPPAFDAGTLVGHEAKMYTGGIPERFVIDNPLNVLNEGNNVLSIQLHNISETSSDLSLIAFLSAIFLSPSSDGTPPPSILRLNNGNLHSNFKISSNSETLFLSDDQAKLIDELLVENLLPDKSIGWSPGKGKLVYYEEPTPGAANAAREFVGVIKDKVAFSHEGGILGEPLELVLSTDIDNAVIRYTLDSSIPEKDSEVYTQPILINDTKVIRARIFKEGFVASSNSSKSFIFNAGHALPVVALVTEPRNFFDEDYGIYTFGKNYDGNYPHFGANFWEDWERPIQFSFYESDTSLGVEFNAGTKIFGGWSRGLDQRSLSIFARGQYRTPEINFPFFPNRPYDTFQALVLRNSGNDWLRTMVRDIALTSLMEGTGLDFQAYRSVVTYLNGDYWGIYNLREKVNEHFLASRHKLDPDDIDLLEGNGQIVEGDNQDYWTLISYINATDLKSDANFQYVADRIDIDNYILYQLSQIYFNNTDWPGNNIKFWKHPQGKWRWILFDTDFGFGIWNPSDYNHNTLNFALEENGPGWPNPPWSTLLFRKLVTNIAFRNKFINRYADELNTRFLPEKVANHIQSIYNSISSELPAHFDRWSGNVQASVNDVQNMMNFARNRPAHAKRHIRVQFQLPNFHNLTLLNDEISRGFIRINEHLNIRESSWSGDYFETVPISLKAVPEAGFEFSHWSGTIASTKAEILLDLESTTELRAHFVPSQKALKAIVINEINYNSADAPDPGDWIELYNPNSSSIDMSNWIFKDNNDDNSFVFPNGSSIEANGFLVVARNESNFTQAFPELTPVVGDFDFGLSSNGDAVRIFNDQEILQDEVIFESDAPWPTCANGSGMTLELIAPNLNNSLPEHWDCNNTLGSPARRNSDPIPPEPDQQSFIVFPNPVGDFLYFKDLDETVDLVLCDGAGRIMMKRKVIGGLYIGDLQPGFYLGQILIKDEISYSFKVVKN